MRGAGDDLPALRAGLGAGRAPAAGRKSSGLGSGTRAARRPRGLAWVPCGDRASTSRRMAGSGAPGLAGRMSFEPGEEQQAQGVLRRGRRIRSSRKGDPESAQPACLVGVPRASRWSGSGTCPGACQGLCASGRGAGREAGRRLGTAGSSRGSGVSQQTTNAPRSGHCLCRCPWCVCVWRGVGD
jgi:hypothetical protein